MDVAHTWMHMDEHEPHVGWIFFEKLPWARCPMVMNRSIISHYLQFCSTSVLGTYFCHNLVLFLLCFYNKVLLHSHCANIIFCFWFLIPWLKFRTKHVFVHLIWKPCCFILFVHVTFRLQKKVLWIVGIWKHSWKFFWIRSINEYK
jgi:hypothetical protein